MILTVHSQVTFRAPAARNRLTMCRQAAMKAAGDVLLVAPGVPVAVHLVAEAHDDRAVVGADSPGVAAQVAVVPPGRDSGDTNAVRVHLHDRHRAVASRGRGEGGLERLEPAAVVGHQARLDAGGGADRGHPRVGARHPGRVPAQVGGGRGRKGEAAAGRTGRGVPSRAGQHHGQRDGRRGGGYARRRGQPDLVALPPSAPSAPSAATAEEASHEPGLPYVLAPLRNAAIAAGLLRPKAWPTLLVELNHTNPSSP